MCSSDEVWKVLLAQNDWQLEGVHKNIFDNILWLNKVGCVECGEVTPYVFTLLDVRLCEDCERTHQEYALVTKTDAMVRLCILSPCRSLMYLQDSYCLSGA